MLIDTDPAMGTAASDPEDSFAITLALNSPEADVVAITCVQGNVPVTHGYSNATYLLGLLGRSDVPVAAGRYLPLHPERRPAQVRWLEDGEARERVIPAFRPERDGPSAIELISKCAREAAGELVIVAIGPLTNIAGALQAEPELAKMIKELWIMGGAFNVSGNHTPFAEFNFWADPDAADIVVRSGIKASYVGLDVCRQTCLTRSQVNRDMISSELGRFVLSSCATWFGDLESRDSPAVITAPGNNGLHLYDSLTVASCLVPGTVTTVPAWVSVDTAGGAAQGASGAWMKDLHGSWLKPGGEPNGDVATDLHRDQFDRLFADRVLSLL